MLPRQVHAELLEASDLRVLCVEPAQASSGLFPGRFRSDAHRLPKASK